MILKLKYFGMIAEAIGKEEESIEFSGETIEDLDKVLKNSASRLNTMNYKFAVNHAIVEDNYTLTDQDEIALLPPFAGG